MNDASEEEGDANITLCVIKLCTYEIKMHFVIEFLYDNRLRNIYHCGDQIING